MSTAWLTLKIWFILLQRSIGHWLLKRKNNAQMSVKMKRTFTADDWKCDKLPTMSGSSLSDINLLVDRAFLMETIITTWKAEGKEDVRRALSVGNSVDLLVTGARSGDVNCFPNEPQEGMGIAGPTFSLDANSSGISWPLMRAKREFTVSLAVEESVLYQTTRPDGYGEKPASVEVIARFALVGSRI